MEPECGNKLANVSISSTVLGTVLSVSVKKTYLAKLDSFWVFTICCGRQFIFFLTLMQPTLFANVSLFDAFSSTAISLLN